MDDVLGKSKRWSFVEPLKIHEVSSEKSLVMHPPTGSWAIIPNSELSTLTMLVEASRRGILDKIESSENSPILEKLMSCGLLKKNEETAWSTVNFDHSLNLVNTLILKMVGHCNLACTYCYDYNKVTYKERLPLTIAKSSIEQALKASGAYLTIIFHGGEPLLAFKEIEKLVPFAQEKANKMGKKVFFLYKQMARNLHQK